MRKKIEQILKDLETNDNFRILKPISKNTINFASNDYLSISNDKKLKKDFLDSINDDNLFFSAQSSRILNTTFSIYEEFESFLAQHFKPKKCLFFNSGYHLNISCIQALSSIPNTFFICDKYAHASIIDGLRISNAKFKRYLHNDMNDLESILESNVKKYDNIVILSEGLFSMDGDFAPLLHLVALKKKYKNILLYIDEAHSIGACGAKGFGLINDLGIQKYIDFIIFTFGKAISSIGACVLCDRIYKDFFINKARGLIYSTALPPINVAFSLFIFKQLQNFNDRRKSLQDISNFFRYECNKILQSDSITCLGEAHIISLVLGQNKKVSNLSNILLKNSIYTPAIKEPTVPKNTARLRISLQSNIQKKQILKLLEIVKKWCEENKNT